MSQSNIDWLHQCHGLGIGVEGPNLVLEVGAERRLLIFDEAMEFQAELEDAVSQATANALADDG